MRGETKALSDQAEHGGSALAAGLLARAQAARRGLHEVLARLWASLWPIVAVAVIMVALIGFADLPSSYALAGLLGFVALVAHLGT